MTEIIMQAYNVLDELKTDPLFIQMKELDQKIASLYQKEIQSFTKAKEVYEDVMTTGGSYHPDYKDAIRKLSETKSELYGKPEVMQYVQTEKAFQDMINEFLQQMTSMVSTHIKTPNKLGIVQKGGSCHVR
jgi:cell fate (sporulation/competence/biofilm development) regulator YlbF (YheA/YmcA/DUF963 family)